MLINGSTKVYEVQSISNEDRQRVMDFLQGAVYCWIKNRKGEWFAARDFLGGDNFYWEGTPVEILTQNHKENGKITETSVKNAGVDAGRILKKVLEIDKRSFEQKEEFLTNMYRCIDKERSE